VTQVELLFDPTGEKIREWHSGGRVGKLIRRFCIGRIDGENPEFTGRDLFVYVLRGLPADELVAPDTPRRVLGLMREKGMLDYEVTNRARSRFKVLGVRVSKTETRGTIRSETGS